MGNLSSLSALTILTLLNSTGLITRQLKIISACVNLAKAYVFSIIRTCKATIHCDPHS